MALLTGRTLEKEKTAEGLQELGEAFERSVFGCQSLLPFFLILFMS